LELATHQLGGRENSKNCIQGQDFEGDSKELGVEITERDEEGKTTKGGTTWSRYTSSLGGV